MNVDTNKVGLVFATIAGGVHVVWSLIVLLGWGQSLVNFIFWAHMVSVPFKVGPFNALASLSVIAVAAALGYLIGCAAGAAWNKLHATA